MSTRIILLAALSIAPLFAHSQDTLGYRNEAGIYGEQRPGGVASTTGGGGGILYRRWHTPQRALRLSAGAMELRFPTSTQLAPSGKRDTLLSRGYDYRMSLGVLGVGVEAQRHLYRRVHVYAAVDVRLGFGESFEDLSEGFIGTGRDSAGQESIYTYSAATTSRRYTDGYLAVMPVIGARIAWNRLTIGLETANGVELMTRSTTYPQGRVSRLFDFSLAAGAFNNRLYTSFRF